MSTILVRCWTEPSSNRNYRKYRKINCTAWNRCCSNGWWEKRRECWCPGAATSRRSTVGSTPARSSSIEGNRTRYLLKGVNVKIRLVRSKDAIALVAGGNDRGYKINIVDAAVFARKATLNTTVQVAHVGNSKRGRSNIRCLASSSRCSRYRTASCHVS